MSSHPQAEAIAKYSSLFRRSEGLYLSYPYEDTMEEDFLDMIDGREFDLVVCSDAQAILGIGDQGVGVSSASLLQNIHCTNTASIGYWCAYHESHSREGTEVALLDFHGQGSYLQVRVGERFIATVMTGTAASLEESTPPRRLLSPSTLERITKISSRTNCMLYV